MSDNYTEPDENEDGEDDFKNMRAAAKRAPKLEKELAEARRELAFVKAGIPMDDPKMGYFVKGYDGDLEASSIKQAAIEAGFLAPPSEEPDPAVQQAQQGQQRVVQAAQGADSGYDVEGGLYAMEQAYNEGGREKMLEVARQYGVGTEQHIL
jgi:hypothetical protein